MRLRNLKNKEEILNNSLYFIENPFIYKGKWSEVFQNENPIYIEIGMGKGKFIIENAIRYPEINFIGIEKYDNVLARSLQKIPENIKNLKIIRLDALQIEEVFDKEVARIYLNFSDPWPKSRHEDRRLTSEIFLKKYDFIFKNQKIIEMRTDNRQLFTYSLISFSNHPFFITEISLDFHKDFSDENLITTEYEDKFTKEGLPIYYVKVSDK